MVDNPKRIKKVFKLLSQEFSKFSNKLEKALQKIGWPIEIFFISLTNEIIKELEKINIDNESKKTHKKLSSNISNNSIYLEKSGKTYLYQMIHMFDEIKNYKEKLTDEIIEYIITPENIQKILKILMATNKITNTNSTILKELNEFNFFIMNFLINIINLNNKILVDVLSSQSNNDIFHQLFIIFSKTVENRNLLYELERNIFLYYPENINIKEEINYTIGYLNEELNEKNCIKIIEEIKKILFLYKNNIDIISKNIMKLIITIFNLYENNAEKISINDFLKFCFNEICFDGNNKFYSRYIFTSANKSKTIIIRNTHLNLNNDNQKIDNNNNNLTVNNNIIRGNTVKGKKSSNNIINEIIENKDDIDNKDNDKNKSDINENKENKENENNENNENKIEEIKNVYNQEFINFLFDVYNELINLKLKKSFNIFFLELFLSINNSEEGKNEYLFLLNNTNYRKIILPSLYILKDELLIAVFFSKIIFLSISINKKEEENNYYIPEIDVQFIINNMTLFLQNDEDKKILTIISSQMINLIKMNNKIIDIILNKCNIYDSFLSIINSDIFNNEIKKNIIEFLEKILKINNNKNMYKLNIPITSYNVTDTNLIKKIYSLSLIYENNIIELNNKIIIIVDYMRSLYEQNKMEELIIFFDILLDSIYRNILKISNYKLIDDETINKLNNILYDISLLKQNNPKINYEEIIFILLKFSFNYNKKYILFKLNKIPTDNRNKIIIDENIIYSIIKNFFINETDLNIKNKLINNLFLYCLDIDENTDITNKNRENIDEDEIYKYLLKAPNIIVKILNILYDNKDYQCLEFSINKIMILIKISPLNIKILLNNNNLVEIIIKLIIDIFKIKEEEALLTQLNILLNEISKYLSEKLLIQYLSEIYLIFYKAISSSSDINDIYNNQYIIFELFNILKYGIIYSKNNYNSYISLSNFCFYNPFIYNLFYIKDLKYDDEINFNIFLCLTINIRISSYNNIGIFHLADFISKTSDVILSFSITNDKKLLITENYSKSNKKNIISEINNINNVLNDDGNFHRVSIIINTESKNILLEIDEKKIELNEDDENSKYNLFDFNQFDIFIGYKSESVKNKLKETKVLSNISIIDIRNILLTKFNKVEDFNSVINKKGLKDDTILQDIYKNKYYSKKNNKFKTIQNKIIAEINFRNNNINIIKSNKIKNELLSLNDFLSNNIFNNKYISYFNIYIPYNSSTTSNCCNKVYMLTIINNLEVYYSLNNSNNIILYNINTKYIKYKIFENYNTSANVFSYFFIDFLILFFYDIEKRRKNIIEKNEQDKEKKKENEKDDNINQILDKDEIQEETLLLNNPFLNNIVLIIIEIIVELPNEEIINYFLYKNDIISIKLKIFFYRNIYLFNQNNDFIQKLFEIIGNDQKLSILEEEEEKYNKKILLLFIIEIFLDLLFFSKLNVNNQNFLLIKIIQLLCNNIYLNDQEYINNILFKILTQIYNIILYHELSLEKININLDDNNNNPTQIDLIIKIIDTIFFLIKENNNKKYINKILNLNLNIINFYSDFIENSQNHNVKNFNEENKSYISYSFLDSNIIYNQLQKIITSISKLQMKEIDKNNNDNMNIDIINKENKDNDNDNNNNEKKICYFCLYINGYLKIKFDNIYNNIKFDKIMDINYINIFLNFSSFRQNLGVNNFSWFLSRNESNHKIQNKFFLKKNDIRIKNGIKRGINVELFTYEYIYDKEKYNIILKSLYEIFLHGNITKDCQLINIISKEDDYEINTKNDEIVENCLYIKAIHKTLSIIIVLNNYILILTNICIDNNKRLHVVKNEIDTTIWCSEKEDYENELENFISKNDEKIIKELFTNTVNNKFNGKGFGYNNSYDFSYKKIYYKNISEMHRTSYLSIPNSIEIFMNNGKSYFICLNITKREKIFLDIISKINEYYRNKDIKLEGYSDFIGKKLNRNSTIDYFYMKYCPATYLDNNSREYNNSNSLFGLRFTRKKTFNGNNLDNNIYYNNIRKGKYITTIINTNTFLSEVSDLWSKNLISNYDYLMLLNILSGRSLNNLSQYFIFPRLLNDFSHNILNWISSSIYRDLSYPIYVSDPLIRSDVKNKYDSMNDDKYHSGTFYSTFAFVSYYLIRQRPYSEISLEIQGGEFDATDRLFIGAKEMSQIKDKYQESIPALMTLQELYMNTNKFKFGKRQNSLLVVNDFELPNWSKDDPRRFSLVIKRIFESKNVNIKLNNWIDLIFGIAQSGPEAIKYCNTYRRACYELSSEEIEELKQNGTLLGILIEKQEMGYNPKQIFKKLHKKKENINEYLEYENTFFDTYLKLRKIQLIKINNNEYDKEKNKILFNSINDILIDIDNDYIKNTNINNNYQGGIASLKSIMKAVNDKNNYIINQKNNNPLKIINILEKVNKFVILGTGYYFLGKNYDYILSYNDEFLEIINYKYDLYFCYYLNEFNSISTLITNEKGNKIYIAFNNGNIIEYKVTYEEEEYLNEYKNRNKNIIYPIIKSNFINKFNKNFNDIYFYDLKEENINKKVNPIKRTDTKIKNQKKQKGARSGTPSIIILEKNLDNNFTFNNPHIPEKIIKIKLNEENKVLIAITVSNIIYLISLNNKFKLMHIITYYSNYKYQYKIKDIIPLSLTGDFLIYSSITVHLFSINGVPLCELNLLDKVHESLTKIESCRAAFLYDIILFTGHENFSIIIWKVKNKNMLQNFNERVSYLYNNNKSKFFLNEYYYNYDFDLDDKTYNYNIQECELRRKFEIVSQIKMEDNLNKLSIKYMKLSQDMSYMIILDNKKDIYILSNFDDYKEEFTSSNNNLIVNTNNNNIFGYFKEKKMYCISCCKEIKGDYYRASRFQSFSNFLSEEIDNNNISNNSEEDLYSEKNDNEISTNSNQNNINDKEEEEETNDKEKTNYICEECKLKLINTESYLYNY